MDKNYNKTQKIAHRVTPNREKIFSRLQKGNLEKLQRKLCARI